MGWFSHWSLTTADVQADCKWKIILFQQVVLSEWQYTKPKSQTLKRAALIFIQSMNRLLSLIAIFVFQSPHLRPPEIIIKTFLYHLSLFKDSTNFLKCHRFSLTESFIRLPTCSAALCSQHCTHDCTQTALELTLMCLISIDWLEISVCYLFISLCQKPSRIRTGVRQLATPLPLP